MRARVQNRTLVAVDGMRQAFKFCFTLLTAFVILSLFISIVTMSMFEVIELRKIEHVAA